jgi:hypothetical protein
MDEPTGTGGEDVLDPIDVPSVGESDHEAVPVREDVDWGPVDTSAETTLMKDNAEEGQAPGHGPKRGVGEAPIDMSKPSRKRHKAMVPMAHTSAGPAAAANVGLPHRSSRAT